MGINPEEILQNYSNYEYEITTKRGQRGSEGRYERNPFILRLAILLDYAQSGLLVERKSEKKASSSKYTVLEKTTEDFDYALRQEMYVVRGRTNKKLVEEFLKRSGDKSKAPFTLEEICDHIFLTYQNKRKYKADHTLEELADFMSFTGDSATSILLRGAESCSFIEYIAPECIKEIDEMTLSKAVRFPAIFIPAFGILIYIEAKKRTVPKKDSSQSNNIFTFLCSDPLNVIKPWATKYFGIEYDRDAIENILKQYKKISTLFAENPDSDDDCALYDEKNTTNYAFSGVSGLERLKTSSWYQELLTYFEKRQAGKNALAFEMTRIEEQRTKEYRQRQQNKKASLDSILKINATLK